MRAIGLLFLFLAVPLGANAQQRCSDFRTCEEAEASFRNGNTKLDRDRDGIPCESLCSGGGGGGSKGKPTKRSSVQPQQRLSSPPLPSPVAKVAQPRQPATLASVGDGDTIRVSTRSGQRLTIRLACIDAPEMAQGLAGQDARVALAEMVKSGPLEIKPQTTDKYGRTVAELFVGGKNVNLALVRGGHAFAYRKYLSQCDQAAYLGAEAWAQQYGQGVWRYGTERPWEFRQRRREK
jgi:micrococcal nuclease